MAQASNRTRPVKLPDDDAVTVFRLYIADETIASEQAVLNLRILCEDHVAGRYEVETVDILRQPLRAMSEGVLITPTLVRLTPLPVRKIVGDLSDTRAVLKTLGFSDRAQNDKL